MNATIMKLEEELDAAGRKYDDALKKLSEAQKECMRVRRDYHRKLDLLIEAREQSWRERDSKAKPAGGAA